MGPILFLFRAQFPVCGIQCGSALERFVRDGKCTEAFLESLDAGKTFTRAEVVPTNPSLGGSSDECYIKRVARTQRRLLGEHRGAPEHELLGSEQHDAAGDRRIFESCKPYFNVRSAVLHDRAQKRL